MAAQNYNRQATTTVGFKNILSQKCCDLIRNVLLNLLNQLRPIKVEWIENIA